MIKDRYIEFRANKFREDFGLTPNEPIDVYKLLAKIDVLSIFKKMSDNFSGMAIKSETERFMLVNSNDTIARQHFTICHEIYHLFIQENFENRICKVGLFDKRDKEEYNADWFASYLLLPETGLLEQLGKNELELDKINLETVVKIEQYFGASRAAVINRLRLIGLLSNKRAAELREKGTIKRSAYLMGYTTELYEGGNDDRIIGKYGEKSKRLYDRDIISETDFRNLMLDINIDIDKILEDGKAGE